jgi:HK97 family phage portal protein
MLTKAKNIFSGLRALSTRGGDLAQAVHHFERHHSADALGDRPSRSYSQVAVVYNCVRAKSDALGMMPLRVSNQNDQVIESGPLAELAEKPNPTMSGRQFRRTTSSHLDLFGRVHWVFVANASGQPIEIHVITPLQMRPATDRATGELQGWWFKPAGQLRGAREELIPADEVYTILDPDFESPDKPFEGLSPRKAVANAIGQFYKADVANEASLHNGVVPSGVFETDQSLTDAQLDHLERQVEEHYGGPSNRRRPLFMFGGLKFQPTQSNFKDMEFAELKRMTRTDVCSAFQVPPSVAGYYEDDNRAHADAAERMFWSNTMLPRANWLAEEFTTAVLDRFSSDRSIRLTDARTAAPGELEQRCQVRQAASKAARRSGRRFYAWFDSSSVPAVQRANLAQVEQAKQWNELGVPLASIIEATGAPFKIESWMRTWWKPVGKVDVQDESSGLGDEPTGGEGDDSLVPENNSVQRSAKPDTARILSPQQRGRIWHQWRRSWKGLENGFKSKVKRHWAETRKKQLDKLHQVLGQAGYTPGNGRSLGQVEKRELIDLLLFSIAEANEGLVAKTEGFYRESIRLGGEQIMQEAAEAKGQEEPDAFNIDDPVAVEKVKRRQVKIQGANRTVQRNIRKQLSEGLDKGESIDELAERVKGQFNVATNRAKTIAHTEVGASVEDGRQEGRKQAGVPMKSWLWSRKESGRPEHMRTESETLENPIPNDEAFTIAGTGISAMNPRGSGVAAQDINCGCTTISRFPDDNIKTAIARTLRGYITYEQLQARDAQRIQRKEAKQWTETANS